MSDAQPDPLRVWCSGEEWCPITATASVMAKKWHPVIVHRLFDGALGFNALKEEVGGISSKVLSDSLDDLGEKGIVERTVVSERPYRVNYSLTERGRDLDPVIESMANWGSKHLVEAETKE